MSDAQLDDLKQFITASFLQSRSQLEEVIETRLEENLMPVWGELGSLRQEMREGFATLSDAIMAIHDVLGNHETRISGLESNAAA